MSERHQIIVIGTPVTQGSKNFVGFTKPRPGQRRGRAILRESGGAPLKSWRSLVTVTAYNSGIRLPEKGPVMVELHFTVPKPKSAPKRKRTWPATRPDCDKYARAVLDSLTDAGVYGDDGQVIRLTSAKYYPNEDERALDVPGVLILLEAVKVDEQPLPKRAPRTRQLGLLRPPGELSH